MFSFSSNNFPQLFLAICCRCVFWYLSTTLRWPGQYTIHTHTHSPKTNPRLCLDEGDDDDGDDCASSTHMQIGPEASLSSASASASASTWLRLGFVCGFLVAAKISVTAERRFVEKLWTVVAAAKHNNKFGILYGREGPRAGRQTDRQQAGSNCTTLWVGGVYIPILLGRCTPPPLHNDV